MSVGALTVAADGSRRRYGPAELDQLTDRACAGLAGRGIGARDRVLVRLPKGVAWLVALRALYRLGAVSVCCPSLLPDDLAVARGERVGTVLALLHPADLPEADGVPPPAAATGTAAPAFVLFTSGTEATPKAVVHRRSYVEANRLQTTAWMGARAGDRVWCTAGTGWSKSLRNAWLAPALVGAETVLHDARFDAAERLELIADLRPTVLCMSPTEYRFCARAATFSKHDFRHVREAVAAGETLDAGTIVAWREAYGLELRDGYGQTETGAVCGVAPGSEALGGSMGRPLPGVEVDVVDGELRVAAATLPTLFAGYLDDEPATARAFSGDWFRTGDLVRRDRAGLYWHEGRRDDVISSAGYRIGPAEIEAALCRHPAVLEAAVVGRPDADRGQVVHADVVVDAARAADADLTVELKAHVRRLAPPYACPRSLRFVAALPRTESGKLRRAAVRASLEGAVECPR